MASLDDKDRRILARLQQDAGAPVGDLAAEVGMSVSACSRRIARLEAEGVIERRVAVLDRRRMGLPTTVFVLVKTSDHTAAWLERFRAAIQGIPEIVEVHRLTGSYDYILKMVVPDVDVYDTVYKRLVARVNLFDVSAYISMETMKLSNALPTNYA